MRITQQMLHQSSVRHMNQNLSRFEKTGQQVSTGKLLASPSDDPVGAGKSMNLKSAIAANQQFTRNIDTASMWLEETDNTLNQTVNILHRVRELAVQGSNDAMSGQDRATIAAEVEQLAGQIRELANTKVNGKYVFNGQKTNQPPYPEPDSYKTDSFDTGAVAFSVADGVVIKANVTADVLFGTAEDDANLFQSLEDLAGALRDGGAIPLGKLDKGMDRILNAWAETGAVKGRMDAIENRLKDSHFQLHSMLSKLEDVDFAEAITKLKSEEAVYQASLSVTSKMIQSTLVDYLR